MRSMSSESAPGPAPGAPSFAALLDAALRGQYTLVVDARSQREYAEDHVPGATNLPVVDDDEYAEVGTVHRGDSHRAYLIGVSYALRNMAQAIEQLVARYPKDSRMLVYCFRGGKRSKLWFDALSTIGYRVDRLPGGWKAYRAWVREQLEQLPRRLTYQVLCGPTGCGKTRLLSALAAQGAQVLDLEGLACHRGSLIGQIPGVRQPTQKWFDSLLVDTLRRFDPARPVWIEAESKKIGAIELPAALMEALHRAHVLRVSAPMPERVKLWQEDYSHFQSDPAALLERLRFLRPLVGSEEFARWQQLADGRQMAQLFQRLMEAHYDPAYARSIRKHYPGVERSPSVDLQQLGRDALAAVAKRLVATAPAE
jgi:tRNA 2-selenouridine synthase